MVDFSSYGGFYNFQRVEAQLNDLPATFKRPNAPYLQLIDSLATTLATFTEGGGGLFSQLTFASARGGWLDCWGAIWGIPRAPNESDALYGPRIKYTLNAWVGTLPALQAWVAYQTGQPAVVSEFSPGPGYSIQTLVELTATQIATLIASLARIRPAGVPFALTVVTGGLYLDTVNYLDASNSMPGTYLDGGGLSTSIGCLTNNSQPTLPEYYLTDPVLNPVFAST